jgi:hypothetical protein
MERTSTRLSPAEKAEGIRKVAAALGVCVGVSGLDHGFFETLQGSTRTPGLLIAAIGPDQVMWAHGTEDAFTIVPNFLITGILAMVLGLATIVWSIGHIDRPDGSRTLLLLGSVLFLVGGGAGMVVFLLAGWAAARRIHRPSGRSWSILPPRAGAALRRALPGLVAAGLASYLLAVAIAITGYVPGVPDPDQALVVCWGLLLASLAMNGLAYAGASARRVATPVVEAAT